MLLGNEGAGIGGQDDLICGASAWFSPLFGRVIFSRQELLPQVRQRAI